MAKALRLLSPREQDLIRSLKNRPWQSAYELNCWVNQLRKLETEGFVQSRRNGNIYSKSGLEWACKD